MDVAGSPMQIRNQEAEDGTVSDRPFVTSVLSVAGFAIIDDRDIDTAIGIVSRTLCAIAYGAGGRLAGSRNAWADRPCISSLVTDRDKP